jgi:hypothetical protein
MLAQTLSGRHALSESPFDDLEEVSVAYLERSKYLTFIMFFRFGNLR